MSTDNRYVQKLMAIVGPDRSRHSPEEISEAEAELEQLATGSLAGDPRQSSNDREKGPGQLAIPVGLAALLVLAWIATESHQGVETRRAGLARPAVHAVSRSSSFRARPMLPLPNGRPGFVAGPSLGAQAVPAGAIGVFRRLFPPHSSADVDNISGSLPLPRSDVGAAATAAHPFVLAVPGNKTATSLRAAVHPVSETGYTWGETAVYVANGDAPPVYAGRLAASSVSTGDQVLELHAPAPFTQALFYPLDRSGSFYQSSLDLEWVEFR